MKSPSFIVKVTQWNLDSSFDGNRKLLRKKITAYMKQTTYKWNETHITNPIIKPSKTILLMVLFFIPFYLFEYKSLRIFKICYNFAIQ